MEFSTAARCSFLEYFTWQKCSVSPNESPAYIYPPERRLFIPQDESAGYGQARVKRWSGANTQNLVQPWPDRHRTAVCGRPWSHRCLCGHHSVTMRNVYPLYGGSGRPSIDDDVILTSVPCWD